MLLCEADTKKMVVLIKGPFLCMYCGYFGEKKHERNTVSDMFTLSAESKHMTPTVINGSTRLRNFSANDAENRKQL